MGYLIDEAPNGMWQRVPHGYADSHSWMREDLWKEMKPGRPYEWKLNLMPTAVVVDKGHRLVLVIASQESRRTASGPCFSDYIGGCYSPSGILPATTAGRATNTVLTGKGATRLDFHWVDPTATRKPPTG